MELGDGIDFFRKRSDPKFVAELLASCTVWVDPKCYHILPVWAPYTYRKAPLYQQDWASRQMNKDQPKSEGNVAASIAQNRYLGIKGANKTTRPNWTCCHIWGNDDPSFQSDHAEVNDPRYFSCPANMVLLPSPMKTFTDTIPEVKAALRYAAYLLYGFWPEGRDAPNAESAGEYLPKAWKNCADIKYDPWTDQMQITLQNRYHALVDQQKTVGPKYPHDQVKKVANYWGKKLPDSLFSEW